MTTSTEYFRPVHSIADSPEQVASELSQAFGPDVKLVTLFFAPRHDGAAISRHLQAAIPGVQVIGCSTSGELSTQRLTTGGVSAAGLSGSLVKRSAVALGDVSGGIAPAVRAACGQLEEAFGRQLRELDRERHVGLIFIDSAHGIEEAVHVELGNLAPFLSFVGGSAGDDLAFQKTFQLAGDATTTHGFALAVLEVTRPFEILKVCHFESSGVHYEVTRVEGRLLYELDGRPAAEIYAEQVGVKPEELRSANLTFHPAGIVIEGEAWVRQAVPPVTQGGAILLGCEVVAGSTLHFLKPKTDIVSHLKQALSAVRGKLGGKINGALAFDCAYRKLESEQTGVTDEYARAFDFPVAGFHTHGESWIGHMHQTLTAIAFG